MDVNQEKIYRNHPLKIKKKEQKNTFKNHRVKCNRRLSQSQEEGPEEAGSNKLSHLPLGPLLEVENWEGMLG